MFYFLFFSINPDRCLISPLPKFTSVRVIHIYPAAYGPSESWQLSINMPPINNVLQSHVASYCIISYNQSVPQRRSKRKEKKQKKKQNFQGGLPRPDAAPSVVLDPLSSVQRGAAVRLLDSLAKLKSRSKFRFPLESSFNITY